MYLFKAKTKEAFIFKVLGELLANTLVFAPFRFTESGIFLKQSDKKNEILINVAFDKDNFSNYKCAKPINFIVNSYNFYKMLKTIKKKDSVTIFITEEEPDKLCICVEQADENNKVNTYIKISYNQMEDMDPPSGYNSPISMNHKEFQKMKNLHNISKTIEISSKPGFIKFFCDGGDLYSREITIGEENNEDDEEKEVELYQQTFFTQHLTVLTKCAGLSGNVKIYTNDQLPIKINMNLGNIGELSVFIKSKEMIDEEVIDLNDEN